MTAIPPDVALLNLMRVLCKTSKDITKCACSVFRLQLHASLKSIAIKNYEKEG